MSNTLLEIRENIATINGAGTVSITAYTRNDTVFGFSTQIITINRRNQSVSFEALSTKTFGNGSFVLEAKSSSGLPVMFSVSSTLVSINTNTASIKGAGTVNITAYSGNSVLFGFVTRMLTIYKATQSVSFGALSTKTFGDGPFVLQASSSSGLPIIFLVSNNLVSINNNTVTINGAGMVNITAYQIGNENYLQGFALQTLAIQTTIINPLTFIGKETLL